MNSPDRPDKIIIELDDLEDVSTGQGRISIDLPPEQVAARAENTPKRVLQADQWNHFGEQAQPFSYAEATEMDRDYPKAGFGPRFLAYMVDGVITFLPLIAAIAVFYWAMAELFYSSSMVPYFLSILLVMAASVWTLFYRLVRDGLGRGQSIGKKMFGLMVVRLEDNQPCTKANSAIRNLYAMCLSIIDQIIGFIDEKGQRYGDKSLKTQVIHTTDYRR